MADKGYRKAIRPYLRRGIRYRIRSNERRAGLCNRATYLTRHDVERRIKQLKQIRRLATRHEKAENHRATVVLR